MEEEEMPLELRRKMWKREKFQAKCLSLVPVIVILATILYAVLDGCYVPTVGSRYNLEIGECWFFHVVWIIALYRLHYWLFDDLIGEEPL